MKVIFLDFDGVLRSDDFTRHLIDLGFSFDDRYDKFDLHSIFVLNQIIEQTGAKVVISSSWRKVHSVEELQNWLNNYGFKGEVIDKTCSLNGEKSPGVRYVRGDEIAKWIDSHKYLEGYVILDDDTDMADLMESLVKIDYLRGLTPDYIPAIISVLNKDPYMLMAKRLDEIFEETNQAFENNKFEEINDKLKGVSVETESIEVLMGWLTACLVAYDKLLYIDRFYERVEERLKKTETEDRVKALLHGLDPSRKKWHNQHCYGYHGWD